MLRRSCSSVSRVGAGERTVGPMRRAARVSVLCVLSSVALPRAVAASDEGSVPIFTISKSENRNQVRYLVRVDERCAPVGPSPIFAFWRMLERGPDATEPLLARETRAYGVESQTVTARGDAGGTVLLRLNAVPLHDILVETHRIASGQCAATATAQISGVPAHLFNVHVALKWPLRVDYLLFSGWTLDGAQVIEERVRR